MSDSSKETSQAWLLAEYEFLWTSQSDINGRIVTVYTQSMSVALALLGAVGIWALGGATGATTQDALLRAALFALPNAITLVAFSHNLAQRKSVFHVAAYWKAFIDRPVGRPSWATRMDRYREVIRSGPKYTQLAGEANDPISTAYWTVFLATAFLAVTAVASSPESVRFTFALYAFVALAVPALALSWLTVRWKELLNKDFDLMCSAWDEVSANESGGSTQPEA